MPTALIVLAAGQGTRMQSDRPKVLHEVAGAPLLAHALASAAELEPARVVVVTGHEGAAVGAALEEIHPGAEVAEQAERLGTAHAVLQARHALEGFEGDVIVLYGDTPFIRPETLARMVEARREADIVVLGFDAADPARYGRLLMQGGTLERIVEYKDATEEERAVTFCNSGVICADAGQLFALAAEVDNNNASGEYYLTDIVALARKAGRPVTAIACDEAETLGVNSRADLARAEAAFQARARAELMELGVTLQAPETVYLSHDTVIGRDAVIEPNVVFGPGVTVESGARLRAFSHFEGCHIARGAEVGPFARLRPGAELAENVKIGNFVEIKNSIIDEGAKVNHLTYVGDTDLGKRANLGAGTVTCNYDGVSKHRTVIGDGAFVGSSTLLVAPVSLGAGAVTGAGSVITEDVPEGAMALARARQVNKPGLGRKLMEMLRSKAARRKQDEAG